MPVFDSITQAGPAEAGRAVLAASHGGAYSAACALKARLGAVILHDAGVGREQAGIAGLRLLDTASVPAATVTHLSARIGDGADCLARGVLSFVNAAAAAHGLRPGQDVAAALAALDAATLTPPEGAVEAEEARHVREGWDGVVLADSNSLVAATDAEAVFVTGSHGGLLGGRPETAIKAPVFAALYNDADGGIDDAGVSRLPALQARGIAAATVSAWSARIGEARSTFEEGFVTRFNERARALGAEPGIAAWTLVERLVEARRRG